MLFLSSYRFHLSILAHHFLFIVEESTKNIVKTASMAVGSLKDTEFDIRFNPDVYSPGIKHCDDVDPPIAKQRQLVKDAAEFLLNVQIPTFVSFDTGTDQSPLFYDCFCFSSLDKRLLRPFRSTNGRFYAVRSYAH